MTQVAVSFEHDALDHKLDVGDTVHIAKLFTTIKVKTVTIQAQHSSNIKSEQYEIQLDLEKGSFVLKPKEKIQEGWFKIMVFLTY